MYIHYNVHYDYFILSPKKIQVMENRPLFYLSFRDVKFIIEIKLSFFCFVINAISIPRRLPPVNPKK